VGGSGSFNDPKAFASMRDTFEGLWRPPREIRVVGDGGPAQFGRMWAQQVGAAVVEAGSWSRAIDGVQSAIILQHPNACPQAHRQEQQALTATPLVLIYWEVPKDILVTGLHLDLPPA